MDNRINETIFINGKECTRCGRCIRECPVKAIDSHPGQAEINGLKCVGCGQCLLSCRHGAVKLRNDIAAARRLIKNSTVKVASVSPMWITEMAGMEESRFIEALRLLGFTHVSESALGAEKTMAKENDLAAGETILSPRCPVIRNFVGKYAPRHLNLLPETVTPTEAHARMIKTWWGTEAAIIHFTVCPAEKKWADDPSSLIDCSLTFGELKKWFREEGIESSNLFGNGDFRFEPHRAKKCLTYPLCGNRADEIDNEAFNFFAASPLDYVDSILRQFKGSGASMLLDLMACRGGCIGSGALSSGKNTPVDNAVLLKKQSLLRENIDGRYTLPNISLEWDVQLPEFTQAFVAESQTTAALDEIGISSGNSQPDCNACGYGTCRRFAKALSRGEIEKQLCCYYLRNTLAGTLNTLLEKISSGVAIINSKLEIEHANRVFASVAGTKAETLFDSNKSLAGCDARQIVPFSALVSALLDSGEDNLVRDVQIDEKLVTVSVHTVRKHRQVLVICRNMLFSQVRNEEIVKRTQKVIDENMETVRKIALLLGENASRTEAILNSILEANVGADGR